MAAYRRAFVDASRLLKQGSKAVRSCSVRTAFQTQVRSLTVLQTSLVKRANVEIVIANQAQQKFSCIPRIMSSALLSTVPAVDAGINTGDSSGSTEVLEGSCSDEEGLVTPAIDLLDDL